MVPKKLQAAEGHFSEEDYHAFISAWLKSSLSEVTKITTKHDPARECPCRVRIELLDKEAYLSFEVSFEAGDLRLWRGNFHKWE